MEEEDLSDGTDEQGGDELRSSVQSRHHKGGEDVAHRDHHLRYITGSFFYRSKINLTSRKDLENQSNCGRRHVPLRKDGDGVVGHCVASAQGLVVVGR